MSANYDIKDNTDTADILAGWKTKVSPLLAKSNVDFTKDVRGIKLKGLYTSLDLAGVPYTETLPGYAPYLRGAQASMYMTNTWTIRQYAGFSTAEESNAFYHKSLAEGQTGISIAFDLATHRGYDSDHTLAKNDVGKAGVAIDTVEDMKVLLRGIDLNKVSVSMTMNGAVLPIMACFLVAAEEAGYSTSVLRGTIQNDILKEFLARNTYIYGPDHSMRITGDVIEYLLEYVPNFNPISISGYHLSEAGGTHLLELAYTFSNAREYLEEVYRRGINLEKFAKKVSFFFAVGMDFYLEIAKLRAARVLWWELLTSYGVKDPKALVLRTHCQTSGISLTSQKTKNNIVRTTIEALAAIFGGTQSLHTNSYDEAICLPTDEAATVARDTQLIIKYETEIPHVVDPWAGSYLIESLTHQIKSNAQEMMVEISGQGGMRASLRTGWATRRLNEEAIVRQSLLDSGKEKIVGLNCFQRPEELQKIPIRKIDHAYVLAEQILKLSTVKQKREDTRLNKSLKAIEKGSLCQDTNLLRLAVEAMRCRATVGEVTCALENAFPRYQKEMTYEKGVYVKSFASPIKLHNLKLAIDSFISLKGRRPHIYLAKCGQDGHDRGIKVIASSFAEFGFEISLGMLFLPLRNSLKEPMNVVPMRLESQAWPARICKLFRI